MKNIITLIFLCISLACFGQVGNNTVGNNVTPACSQICDGSTDTTIGGAIPAAWTISNIVLQSGAIPDTYSGNANSDTQLESQLKTALDNHAGAAWSVFDITNDGGVGTSLVNIMAEFQGSMDALFSFDLEINGTTYPIGFSTNCYFSNPDCSPTNELQYISLDGTTITQSENGGEIDLSGFVSEVTNTQAGNTIATHNANGTATDINETITNFGTPAVDATDPTNVEVTLPYNQEGNTTQSVVFEIPIPDEVTVTDLSGGNLIGTVNTGANSYPVNETITDFGTPIVDTSDPTITEITLPYNQEGGTVQDVVFEIPASVSCVDFEGTRAAILALRNASSLEPQCHYIITDYNRGTIGAVEIMLHATSVNELSMTAMFNVSCDNDSWSGRYDISANRIQEMRDNIGNVVIGDAAVDAFPWCVAAVAENYVLESTVNYTAGNFDDNELTTNATVTINGGNVYRNSFAKQSNTTINSGDFRENDVDSDATVVSSTTGDVDNNHFLNLSNSAISGTSNLDNSVIETDGNLALTGGNVATVKIGENGNLTMSGGTLSDTKIGEDAEVTIISGSNYENVFGNSTIYRQVGTGYIRYSTIEGTTGWTNGNTNISNVQSYVSTINTTGSTGSIFNSQFNRALLTAMQNVPSLTITDSKIGEAATVAINNAERFYFYRGSIKDGSRILISAGSRIDASYTHLNAYSYLQSTQDGGFLTANYCKLSGVGYIRNTTVNTHRAERCNVTSQASIRFDGDADNGRIYYSSASSGASIYQTTGSVGCYMYYCDASGLGQIYTQNSTNARIYYTNASSRGYIRSLNNTATHYMYYCDASASGYVQTNSNTGAARMYAVKASSQSIVELRNSPASNLYYSNFDAYFYAYVTKTGGTSTGLFGMGRRTATVTQPTVVTPFFTGSAISNF